MGWFDRKKDKKVAPVRTDTKQTTDDKLQAEYEKIMMAAKAEERAAEARQEAALRHATEMSGRLSQLDNSPGHRMSVEVARKEAQKSVGKNSVEDKTKEDGLEFEKFSDVCKEVRYQGNDSLRRMMFSKFQALKEAKIISGVNILLFPYALEKALRESDNPGQALNDFMSMKISNGKTVRENVNVKEIYDAALVAEAIGLVQDHRTTFAEMYDPDMREAVSNERGYNTICHPIDDMIEDLNLAAYQGIIERKGLKVADYTRRGIDKGIGTEEVQDAKSTIRTAMLSRDPNKEDRNAK